MARFAFAARLPVLLLVGLCLSASALYGADAPRGASEYLQGLSALVDGKLDAALAGFDKAIAADDENASYHTSRAVVLYLQNRSDLAVEEIRRSKRLGPTPGTQLWGWAIGGIINMPAPDDADDATRERIYQRQRVTRNEFDSRPPYESREPYAARLIDAGTHFATPIPPAEREAYRKKLVQVAASYAWTEMSSPKLVPAMMATVKSLFDERKYAECLSLIDRLRPSNADDPQLLFYSAVCKLEAGDFQSARDEYTRVLIKRPQDAASYFGRARAAASMDSVARANKDIEIATSIDPIAAQAFNKRFADQIARAAASVPSEPASVSLAALKKSAADTSAPMSTVIEKADRLVRAAAATRFVRAESYTEELQRLDAAATADPKNANKQAAVGEFLINPLTTKQATLDGKTGIAKIPTGDADVMRAQPYLDKALAINPNHIIAMTNKALSAIATREPKVAIQWAEKALALSNNLDLSRVYLDYYTNVAVDMNAQARQIRTPKISHEIRGGLEYQVTTYPSPADLARANELDQQADQLRLKAVGPMQRLAESARGTPSGVLAGAEVARAKANYSQAIVASMDVFKIDPFDIEAREFLIDLYPKVGMTDKAIEQQNISNNLLSPSAGRTLDKVWELLAATKYRSAKETIDQAEAIEPTSVYVPAYRAAVTLAESNFVEFTSAIRQAVAMEEAKQRVFGRSLDPAEKSSLAAADAALPMALRRLWGINLMTQSKPPEAAEQFRNAMALGARVSDTQWDTPIQASALPAAENAKPKGWTIRELLADAQFSASRALLDSGKPEEAGRTLMAYVNTGGTADIPKGTHELGYQIYSKLAEAKAAQVFPQQMLLHFKMMDSQAENKRILQRGDQIDQQYEQQLEALRQRQADLDQQMAAASRARNQNQMRSLQQQRQALSQEMQQLIRQRNMDQMRNVDPNNQGAR